jgi:hypothetical protein
MSTNQAQRSKQHFVRTGDNNNGKEEEEEEEKQRVDAILIAREQQLNEMKQRASVTTNRTSYAVRGNETGAAVPQKDQRRQNNGSQNTTKQQTKDHPAQPDANTFMNHYQDLVMLYKTLRTRSFDSKSLKKMFLTRNLMYIAPSSLQMKKNEDEDEDEGLENNNKKKQKKNKEGGSGYDGADADAEEENEKKNKNTTMDVDDENKPRDDLDVMFRYFFKQEKSLVVTEKSERSHRARCPFCFVKPRNFIGLCQHLNASHDQFYFTFLPVNTIQKRKVSDPNRLFVAKSEDRVVTMNTIEVRIKKTTFVMCENGVDKLNMLDATLLKDAANKSFEFFNAGRYPLCGTNKVILPAIGNLSADNKSTQMVSSATKGWENELALLKVKLNEESRNKFLAEQSKNLLNNIDLALEAVLPKQLVNNQHVENNWNDPTGFAKFFTPSYHDQISLERAAAVLNGENAEQYVRDLANKQNRRFGNDIDLKRVVLAAKERVQAENAANVEKLGQYIVLGEGNVHDQIRQQTQLYHELKQQNMNKSGNKRTREELPLGYAASKQLERQRWEQQEQHRLLEKEAKRKRKYEMKKELNQEQQQQNFRQSNQYRDAVTKKTAITETGTKKSHAIGNRYYHSRTCLPMSRKMIKEQQKMQDSDDDEKEQEEMWDNEDALYIDEYVDVAQVEKDFFHAWNKHVRKFCALANRQMPDCTSSFMYSNKDKLIKDRQMRKLFHLHLINMYDFGVLSGKVIQVLIQKMDEFRREALKLQTTKANIEAGANNNSEKNTQVFSHKRAKPPPPPLI